MQVQQQHLVDLRDLPVPRRHDHRTEPVALPSVRVDAAVVDLRDGHLHRTSSGQNLPPLMTTVAHHQPVAVLVPLSDERDYDSVHSCREDGGPGWSPCSAPGRR